MTSSTEGVEDRERPSCDFCGREVESVRRVALDGEYDRLRVRHAVQYACGECSARKDEERATRGDAG